MVIMPVPVDGELASLVQGLVTSEPLDLQGGRIAVVQANQLGGLSDGRVQIVDVLGDRWRSYK